MTAPVLGIDLGTTNSVVAVAEGGQARVLRDGLGRPLIPSVVSFHPSGDILVGYSARERRGVDGKHTVYSTKRLIGRPFRSEEVRHARERFPFDLREGPTGGVLVAARNDTYTLAELSAFVLRQVRTTAEESLRQVCTRAVVTVPANFNELQRSATKAAGKIAGLEVLRILNEPTAAALAYGYGSGRKERVAIFDLGGGTFDVTIMDIAGDVFEVIATAGDTYLGGDDFDVLIADSLADSFLEQHRYDLKQNLENYERLRGAVEAAKCELSAADSARVQIDELAYGAGGKAIGLDTVLERSRFEALIRPLLGRAFDVCEEAMKVAGLRPTQLDNVLLVGGSTRIPLVRKMVGEYFGRAPLTHLDPDLVVAQGAAIQGAALGGAATRQALARVPLKKLLVETTQVAPRPQNDSDEEMPTVVRQQASIGRTKTLAGVVPPPPPPQSHLGQQANQDKEDTTRTNPVARSLPPPPPAGRAAVVAPDRLVPGAPTQLGLSAPEVAPLPADLTAVDANAALPNAVTEQVFLPAGASRPSKIPQTLAGLPLGKVPPPLAPAAPSLATGTFTVTKEMVPMVVLPVAAGEPSIAPLPAPAKPPLLLDVTPQSLGIETVSGYCEQVIRRNAAIPVEQSRVFSTAQDGQTHVRVRICQGESRRISDNQELGAIELGPLRSALRGAVKIGVTFLMDADGTLGVKAKDLETGREQSIRIQLLGGLDDAELEALRQKQSARLQKPPVRPQ